MATEALPATSAPNVDRSCVFLSASGGGRAFGAGDCLDEQHWHTWLTALNSLEAGLKAAAALVRGPAVLIECGAHPVARTALKQLDPVAHVASMRRDVPVARYRRSRHPHTKVPLTIPVKVWSKSGKLGKEPEVRSTVKPAARRAGANARLTCVRFAAASAS